MTPLKIVGRNDFNGLPQMERDKLVAEWKALIRRDKVSQVATPSGGRQPADEAIRETARQLGLSKNDVHRAIKVASITPEAQQAAHEVGNQKQAIAGIC